MRLAVRVFGCSAAGPRFETEILHICVCVATGLRQAPVWQRHFHVIQPSTSAYMNCVRVIAKLHSASYMLLSERSNLQVQFLLQSVLLPNVRNFLKRH